MEKPDICNVEKMKYEPLNNKDMEKVIRTDYRSILRTGQP